MKPSHTNRVEIFSVQQMWDNIWIRNSKFTGQPLCLGKQDTALDEGLRTTADEFGYLTG